MTTLAVLAKAPVPGRVKTRLCPPCRPAQAATIAEAALRDTLDAALATRADRVALVLDGPVPAGIGPAVDVLPQRVGDLGDRLAGAFADLGDAVVVIGMDTPQVGPARLDDALGAVSASRAVLGPATDGGWWLLGLPHCPEAAFVGVTMSRADTCRRQLEQLRACGVEPVITDRLRDVDHWSDAERVAAEAPGGRFAAVVAAVDAELAVRT
jgi:rSAM/selenodomain-associated transferase 1